MKILIPTNAFKVVKIENYRVNVPGGYEIVNGYAVEVVGAGKYLSFDGVRPSVWTKKANAQAVIKDGLYAPIKTV